MYYDRDIKGEPLNPGFSTEGSLISASALPHCGGQTDRQRQRETETDSQTGYVQGDQVECFIGDDGVPGILYQSGWKTLSAQQHSFRSQECRYRTKEVLFTEDSGMSIQGPIEEEHANK